MKIVWTDEAKKDLKKITLYYRIVSSKSVSNKIKTELLEKPKILKEQPEIGQEQNGREGIRYLVQRHFKMLYSIEKKKEKVIIQAIFDTRQEPLSMR